MSMQHDHEKQNQLLAAVASLIERTGRDTAERQHADLVAAYDALVPKAAPQPVPDLAAADVGDVGDVGDDAATAPRRRRKLGQMTRPIRISPDFDDPMEFAPEGATEDSARYRYLRDKRSPVLFAELARTPADQWDAVIDNLIRQTRTA